MKTVQQSIVGFHLDPEQHWVARLECGHNQHVRHDPPWTNRPWVVTEAGRQATLGKLLSCRKCVQGAARDWDPPSHGAGGQSLGLEYPRVSERQLRAEPQSLFVSGKRNVLFVCSKNQWRSPTAETIWRRHPSLSVRSGGTSPSARHKVSVDDVQWAHVILVMEEKHKSRLKAEYGRALEHKPIFVLDIPDDYKYMDPELVVLLQSSVESALGLTS